MTVSYSDFIIEARELVTISQRLGDGWELRHVKTTDGPEETVYLAKKTTTIMDLSPPDEQDSTLNIGNLENIEDEDPAVLHHFPRSTVVNFEYHVVHSPSYLVPMLFFTASYQSGKLVPLVDIWKLLSPVHVPRDSGMEWESVTQLEHPLLGRPFYHIHPCHTASVMATILQTYNKKETHTSTEHGNETEATSGTETHTSIKHGNKTEAIPGTEKLKKLNYLLSWLTIFGPTVGLKISLDYFHSNHFKS